MTGTALADNGKWLNEKRKGGFPELPKDDQTKIEEIEDGTAIRFSGRVENLAQQTMIWCKLDTVTLFPMAKGPTVVCEKTGPRVRHKTVGKLK